MASKRIEGPTPNGGACVLGVYVTIRWERDRGQFRLVVVCWNCDGGERLGGRRLVASRSHRTSESGAAVAQPSVLRKSQLTQVEGASRTSV